LQWESNKCRMLCVSVCVSVCVCSLTYTACNALSLQVVCKNPFVHTGNTVFAKPNLFKPVTGCLQNQICPNRQQVVCKTEFVQTGNRLSAKPNLFKPATGCLQGRFCPVTDSTQYFSDMIGISTRRIRVDHVWSILCDSVYNDLHNQTTKVDLTFYKAATFLGLQAAGRSRNASCSRMCPGKLRSAHSVERQFRN
jgi:hypothetical protein